MPTKEHIPVPRPINHHKYNTYKLISVQTPTPTPLPHDHAVSTQSYRYLQQSADPYDDISYDERPIATVAPKQHLTETTQIQPPTVSTYHPTAIPPTNNNYNPYVKIQKIIHGQSSPIPLQEQPIVVTRNPITIAETPIENDELHATANAQTQQQIEHNSQQTPLTEVLRKLQASNLLPQILNSDNLDDSIQSLVKILNNIKQSQHAAEQPPQHHHGIEYDDDNGDYNHNNNDDDDDGEGNEKRIIFCIK